MDFLRRMEQVFKAIKVAFYKWIERIREKQLTGGGLSAGGQDDGGPADCVGRQDVAAIVCVHRSVAARTWLA